MDALRTIALVAITLGLACGAACEVGPRSGRGLRLPPGDIERGRVAFEELHCGKCHDVAGEPSRAEGDAKIRSVKLGGPVSRVGSYGELVTSIVNPSHDITGRYPMEEVADGRFSKMENFNDVMTVDQLLDLVAYLQSKYELRHEPLYVR